MTTAVPERTRRPVADRLWEKVDRSGECWLWLGSKDKHGYGRLSMRCEDGRHRPRLAHRVAYELERGSIPEGLTLDHLCRTPSCVNPSHLEPVTNRENILRGTGPAARNAAVTHCPKGHVYDEANTGTRVHPWGTARYCRACAREAMAAKRVA